MHWKLQFCVIGLDILIVVGVYVFKVGLYHTSYKCYFDMAYLTGRWNVDRYDWMTTVIMDRRGAIIIVSIKIYWDKTPILDADSWINHLTSCSDIETYSERMCSHTDNPGIYFNLQTWNGYAIIFIYFKNVKMLHTV